MIIVNHLRTLLFNLRAQATQATLPGEEYVPPAYIPVRLPADLERARNALFGSDSDRVGINLNLARLLAYVHASPLAADVLADDARITYDPTRPVDVWDSLGQVATTLEGDDAIAWYGAPAFVAEGRGYGRWVVSADGGGTYAISPGNFSAPVVPTSVGDALMLPSTRLGLIIPSAGTGRWNVTLLTAPRYTFDRAAVSGDPDAVFRADRSAREANWYDVWTSSPLAALRASAFAMALAARIDDIRNNVDPEL